MTFREEILLASKADTRGFKVTESAAAKLNKRIKSLAITFGVAFSVKKVLNFGVAASKAFIQDQKEANRLSIAVKNLGLELSNPAISSYIDKLSKASGVTDGELRPAFQALLTTTGSVTKSQEILAQAIDVSAGSGIELTQVSQDLANAYIGKTKALTKYNLGLSATELKTIKFTDLQKKLNEQYAGANAAYLNTYAGKMQALGVAAGEASETIGGALIDSLMSLSGSATITDLIGQIDTLAEKTAGWIDQFTEGVLEVQAIAKAANGMGILGLVINRDQLARDIQAAQVDASNKKLRRTNMKAWEGIKTPDQIAAEKKAELAAAKRARDMAKATEKNTAELKKQAALKKAGTVFDKEQINLIAALKGKLSEDDKLRAEAQLALLNDNDVLATQLTKQILMAQDSTGKLYQYFQSIGNTKIANPFAFLDQWIMDFQKKLNSLNIPDLSKASTYAGGMDPALAAIGVIAGYGDYSGSKENQSPNDVLNGLAGMQSTAGFVSTASATGMDVKVYVSGSVVTEQELVDAIQSGLRSNSLSGSPSQIGRIAGMFS
jgi:hypothetical protein